MNTLQLLPEPPYQVGPGRPYILATVRPPERVRAQEHFITAGTPTGGLGWPDATDAANPHGYTPDGIAALARLFAASYDHALIAAALTRGTACLEPHTTILGQPVGTWNLTIDGWTWTTRLDEFGVPVLDEVTRFELMQLNH